MIAHDFICCEEPVADDDFIGISYHSNGTGNNDKSASSSNGNKHLSEKSAGKVTRYVVKHFKKLLSEEEFRHLLEKADNRQPIPQLRHSQIELGKMLGEGGFSDVFEVKRFLPVADDNVDADDAVVKVLRPKVTDDAATFAAAAAGLAKEGAILGSLSHPNIIQMKAFSQGGLAAYATGRSDAFFIVLERLHEILRDRITHWSHVENKLAFSIRHRREKFQSFFRERLLVAADLAKAIAHLHDNNILHRDIKPTNIGFDADGTLKLFDFDVSRTLPKALDEDELFHLSLATGTQRYMSPECGLTGKYNLKSDVYSFAIVLHEILSLERPFFAIMKKQHAEVVYRSGHRPRIRESWPKSIQQLLKKAWSKNIKSRPSMSCIHNIISQAAKDMATSSNRKRKLPFPTFKKNSAVGCQEQ